MQHSIYQTPATTDYSGYQLWLNPTNKTVYATTGKPDNGFNDEISAFPLYDYTNHFDQYKIAKSDEKLGKTLVDNFRDEEFRKQVEDYQDGIRQGGKQKLAALRSNVNAAVDIVNVWETVLGKDDRTYAGVNLAKNIAVPNLLISIDTVTKYSGLTRLDEGQLGQLKELPYTRATFTARKYGLKFVIHEEARLKNVHNVLQDSIQVASNKVEQRASFDVIDELIANGNSQTGTPWDTFTSGADRSANNPMDDIGVAQLNIEGSGVGGKLSRVGMHPLTFAKYAANTFIRGVASTGPTENSFESGTRELPGLGGIGLVLDNSIVQDNVIATDTEKQPSCALLQGPQRVGSAHDEETGDDKYFIIDYHLATIIQSETNRIIDTVMTPIDWT